MEFTEIKYKQNYLNGAKTIAISSYGEFFEVGEEVGNTSNELDLAVITSFDLNEESNEIKAYTTEGWQHLDFLRKV